MIIFILEIIALVILTNKAEAIRLGKNKEAVKNPTDYLVIMWVYGVISALLIVSIMQYFLNSLDGK